MDEYNQTNREGQNPIQGQYTPVPPEYAKNNEQNQYNSYQNNPYNNQYSNQYANQYSNPYNNQSSNEGQGFGIASLVIGIISLIMCCSIPVIGLIPSIAAIVLGVMGLKYPSAKGMAIAGIVLGAISGLFALAMTFIFVATIAMEL